MNNEIKEIKLDDSKWYNNIEKWIGIVTLAVALILLTYQVVLRFVFNNANSWSEELSKYLYIYFVFFSGSYGVYKAGQIKIDAFLKVFPLGFRKWVVLFGWFMVLLYAVTVFIAGSQFTYFAYAAQTFSLGLNQPMWIFYLAIPSAHAFMIVRCLQNIYIFFRTKGAYALPKDDQEAQDALEDARQAELHAAKLAEQEAKENEKGGDQ